MPDNVSLYTVKQNDTVRRRNQLAANLPHRCRAAARIPRFNALFTTNPAVQNVRAARSHPRIGFSRQWTGRRKVRHISLRPEQKPLVEGWIKNYHRLKDQIEEVCQLNQTLLRPQP